MLVELKVSWFAPTDTVMKDSIQHISGRRFGKGVHEMDEGLRNVLPKSAKILKGPPKEEAPLPVLNLKDFDLERTASDKLIEVAEEADEQVKRNTAARTKK